MTRSTPAAGDAPTNSAQRNADAANCGGSGHDVRDPIWWHHWWQTHPDKTLTAKIRKRKVRLFGCVSVHRECARKASETTLYRKVQRYRLENVGVGEGASQAAPPRGAPVGRE